MNNELLDNILIRLRDKYKYHDPYISTFRKENSDLDVEEIQTAIQYLKSNKYVTLFNEDAPYESFAITPGGRRLLIEGGFSGQAYYQSRTLKVAIQSRDYALWGVIIGILSMLLSVILFLL